MLIMFLQDAHMRPLWTGVHQEMELNSPCDDSSRNKDLRRTDAAVLSLQTVPSSTNTLDYPKCDPYFGWINL